MTATDYLTAILCVITAIYSYLTYKMSKSSEDSVESIRAQSEAMFRPYVTVSPYIRPNTNVLYLKIENLASWQKRLTGEVSRPPKAGRLDRNVRARSRNG